MFGVLHTTTLRGFKSIVRSNIINTNKPSMINSISGVYCRPIFKCHPHIDTHICGAYGNIHLVLNPNLLLTRFDWSANRMESNGLNHMYSYNSINKYIHEWNKNINGEIVFHNVIYDVNKVLKHVYIENTVDNIEVYSCLRQDMKDISLFYESDEKKVIDL